MGIVKVHASKIKWNVDDKSELEYLPTECILEVEIDELDEVISDKLSEQYGFCHEGFEYEIVK